MRQPNFYDIQKQVFQILARINYFDCERLAQSYFKRLNKKQLSYIPKRKRSTDIVDYAIAEIHKRIEEGRL